MRYRVAAVNVLIVDRFRKPQKTSFGVRYCLLVISTVGIEALSKQPGN